MIDLKAIAHLFSVIVPDVGIAAIMLSSLLICVNVARDAFEPDPKPRTKIAPIGGQVRFHEWRYMSDHAETCRREMLRFIGVFRHTIDTLLTTIVITAVLGGIFNGLASFPRWPLHDVGMWWVKNVNVLNLLFYVVSTTVILFGPLIIWQISDMVYRLLLAKKEFEKYKEWWFQSEATA